MYWHKLEKPLIIKGVRQSGKTYLLKEFGKNYYEDFAYFNFEGNSILRNIARNHVPLYLLWKGV